MTSIADLFYQLDYSEQKINDFIRIDPPQCKKIDGILDDFDHSGSMGFGFRHFDRDPKDVKQLARKLTKYANEYEKEWTTYHSEWDRLNNENKQIRHEIISRLQGFGGTDWYVFCRKVRSVHLPDKPGVYLLFSDHCLDYVGQTESFRRRLQTHSVFQPSKHLLGLIACENERFGLEIELIRSLSPRINRQYNNSKRKQLSLDTAHSS